MGKELFLGYIDPVSGTIILQLIFAGIVGCMVFFRNAIYRLAVAVFGPRGPKPSKPQ